MNRLKIAQYIALGGTAFSLIGFIILLASGAKVGEYFIGIGLCVSLVAYLFGGLFTAIKMAWGIAKWGWMVVPFPYDLLTFAFAFVFSIFAFIFLPILPIRKAYKESMSE